MSSHHFVVITGANRGFGASIAHSYVAHSGAKAVSFVLVGRNSEGLETVLQELRNAGSEKGVAVQGTVVGDVDLGNVEALETNLARIQAATNDLRLNVLVCCSMVAMRELIRHRIASWFNEANAAELHMTSSVVSLEYHHEVSTCQQCRIIGQPQQDRQRVYMGGDTQVP